MAYAEKRAANVVAGPDVAQPSRPARACPSGGHPAELATSPMGRFLSSA